MAHHIPSTKSLFAVGTVVFHGTESQATARAFIETARADAVTRHAHEHARRRAHLNSVLDHHDVAHYFQLPERVKAVTPDVPTVADALEFPALATFSQTVPARKRRAAAKVRPGNGVVKHDATTARGVAACRAVGAEYWAAAPSGYWGTYQGEYVLVTVTTGRGITDVSMYRATPGGVLAARRFTDVYMYRATAGGVLAATHLDGELDTSVPFGADQLSLV